MTGKVARALACLAVVVAVATVAGCTWTETKQEFPASLYRQTQGHDHGHVHDHGR